MITGFKIFEQLEFNTKPLYKIGDNVYYHGMFKRNHGHYTINRLFHAVPNEESEKGDTGWRYLLSNGKMLINGAWEMSISLTEEEGIIKDREYHERKDLLRKKYIDIDPYGEEIWESNIFSRKLKVGDICIFHEDKQGSAVGLNRRIGEKCIIKSIRDIFYIKFIEGSDIIYFGCKRDNLTYCEESMDKFIEKQEEMKLKYKDIDPYGEEIWEGVNSDIDPYGEEIWDDEEVQDDEVNIRFRNYYECEKCGEEWTDEWDSTCDDECPVCRTVMSPYHSEDI